MCDHSSPFISPGLIPVCIPMVKKFLKCCGELLRNARYSSSFKVRFLARSALLAFFLQDPGVLMPLSQTFTLGCLGLRYGEACKFLLLFTVWEPVDDMVLHLHAPLCVVHPLTTLADLILYGLFPVAQRTFCFNCHLGSPLFLLQPPGFFLQNLYHQVVDTKVSPGCLYPQFFINV